MDVRLGLWRKMSAEELMLLNCGAGEDSWEPVHSKGDQPWVFFGRNDAKAQTPVLWPPHAKSWLIGKDWCWKGLGAGGKGDNRGWDGWMASPTRWTCLSELREMVTDREAWHAAIHGVTKSQTRPSDWTKLNWAIMNHLLYYLAVYSTLAKKMRCNHWMGRETEAGKCSAFLCFGFLTSLGNWNITCILKKLLVFQLRNHTM